MANIIAYVELVNDQASWASLLTLRQGRHLATRLGATLYAVLPCATPPLYGDNDIIAVLSRQGADKVILMTHSDLAEPALFGGHGEALLTAITQFPPALLLIPAGPAASDLAPRVAARMGALFASHPHLEADDEHHLLVTQPTHGGTHVRRFSTADLEHSVVAVVVPDPQRYPRAEGSEEAEVVVLSPGLKHPIPAAQLLPTEIAPPGLTERVVLVGRAVDPASLEGIRMLADRLGADLRQTPERAAESALAGVPVLDARIPCRLPGFVLALGVRGSETTRFPDMTYVIAVHPDRSVPLFRRAQLALVAEVADTVKEMLDELNRQPSAQSVERVEDAAPPGGDTPSNAPQAPMGADDTATLKARRPSLPDGGE